MAYSFEIVEMEKNLVWELEHFICELFSVFTTDRNAYFCYRGEKNQIETP